MTVVRITKTSVGENFTDTFIVEFPIYETLRLGTSTPVFAQDIPETDEEQTIVVKVTGNTQRIYFSYKIVDLNGTNLVQSGLSAGISTDTVVNQFNFLENEFRPTGLKDSYLFEITAPFNFARTVNVEDLSIDFDKGDPINPTCNIQMVVGDVITLIDVNVPERPPTNLAVVDSGGNPSVSWTNVATADEGGSAITGYKVERRSQIGSWQTLTSSATTPYSDTSASDIAGTVYKYKVSAVNTQGTGKPSKVVKHTRP